ncbi:hypothetical protein [Neokomagataea thailandica]|uniref:Transcriptional regulator n=1 Tax=Neokomagataea tanensis NBRC 106556 TaxID=1223519 RepID=A0ABQ0QGN1_9PROT|nr:MULTISPECIES: hypothetical protein [Neokomagataea]GBR44181.1 hypothetical protein AA106556_0339 [Neokomagataea tanensis NBRC 106556]
MFHQTNIGGVGARVSSGALAAMLASDGWVPKKKTEGAAYKAFAAKKPIKARIARKMVERDTMEALPAGHSVTWAALWGADKVPAFPGLVPMGGRELVTGIH